MIFGPARLNGAAFRLLEVEQGVGQVLFFLKHWAHTLEPGQLLRIAVSWAQINVGVGYSIFAKVVTRLPHFESKWLASVRNFLRSISGRIRLDHTYVPDLQRVNDTFIMDHVLLNGSFSDRDICRINYCRLYLQVLTISDITNATGDCVNTGIAKGFLPTWRTVTTHRVNQGRPDDKTWKIWAKALLLFSTTAGQLHVPRLPMARPS